MKDARLDIPQFYLTQPDMCPYLPDRLERKLFAHLSGPMACDLNDRLSLAGFRRSQTVAYRPACDTCKACQSIRVLTDDFTPSRTQKRIAKRNQDLIVSEFPARASREQYALFRTYLEARHADGGMEDMTIEDFMGMIENSSVDTMMVEYRLPPTPEEHSAGQLGGRLIGAALCDLLFDGLSMVYSFYDPDEVSRSLGSYMILERLAAARSMGLPHLYLGYFIEDCQKMAYKRRYLPHELYVDGNWTRRDT